MSDNIVGERIASLRKGTGESQEDLATILQCSRGSVANYEVGKRTPDVGMLVSIAQHYNTTVDYLVGNSDSVSKEAELKAVSDYLGVSDDMILFLRRIKTSDQNQLKLINGVFSKECQSHLIHLLNQMNNYLVMYGFSNIPSKMAISFITEDNPELKTAVQICHENGMEVLAPYEQKLHAKMLMEESFKALVEELAYSVYGYTDDYYKKKLEDLMGTKKKNELEKMISSILSFYSENANSESNEGGADNG